MFTQLSTNVQRRFKKSFIGSLVFAVAVFVGFADHSSADPYSDNSIIKTAHAANQTGGGGCGGGCSGSGCSSGGCASGSSGSACQG